MAQRLVRLAYDCMSSNLHKGRSKLWNSRQVVGPYAIADVSNHISALGFRNNPVLLPPYYKTW
jgi:hypothetical protein